MFAEVDAAIQDPDGETSSKYVLYNLEEARPLLGGLGFGAEFGSIGGCDTAWTRLPAPPAFRRASRWIVTRNNLWGLAHSLSLRTRVSTLDQRGLLTIPGRVFDGTTTSTSRLPGCSTTRRTFAPSTYKREERLGAGIPTLRKTITLLYRFPIAGLP